LEKYKGSADSPESNIPVSEKDKNPRCKYCRITVKLENVTYGKDGNAYCDNLCRRKDAALENSHLNRREF
jgi:hypothetical protein